MNKSQWKRKIISACKAAGTYQKPFENVINELAAILERRDATDEKYIASGENPVISHTNKNGAKNLVKNPFLVLWIDLNSQALSYWRDLGLTPSSFKKMGNSIEQVKETPLEKALKELGSGK